MEQLSEVLRAIVDPNSEILLAPGVIQSLFASLVAAVVSLLLIAPLTARWVKWERDKSLSPLRSRLRREFAELLTATIKEVKNIADHAPIYSENKDTNDALFSLSDDVHTFSANQIKRLEAFYSTFRLINDGLEPNERYEISDVIKQWKALDVEFLQNVYTSSFELMIACKNNETPLNLSNYFKIRSLRKLFFIIPDNEIFKFIINYTDKYSDDNFFFDIEENKENIVEFYLLMEKIISNDIYVNDFKGSSYISDTVDLDTLIKRNELVYGDKVL